MLSLMNENLILKIYKKIILELNININICYGFSILCILLIKIRKFSSGNYIFYYEKYICKRIKAKLLYYIIDVLGLNCILLNIISR